MGLCFSNNREYRRLKKTDCAEKRTFSKTTRLARLVSIYDGDTFNIITRLRKSEPFYQYSVRLSGIDAPEIRPTMDTPNRDLHKQAAIRVRNVLRTMYPEGTIFLIDFEKEEKYGRLLGTIWSTKRRFCGLGSPSKHVNISDWLKFNNLALPYEGRSKSIFSATFLQNIV